jgi:RNA methyltransferase, TrmH family
MKITSRQNPLVQRARAVRSGREPELIFIEGVRLAEEAARAGLSCEAALYTDRIAHDSRGAKLLAELRNAGVHVVEVSESVFASIADTKNPQGLALLGFRPRADRSVFTAAQQGIPLLVIMHRINNPTNAGAMLRVAEAAGASGVVATVGSTDLFGSKALRGAMGAAFRLPLWLNARLEDALAWCQAHNIGTVATDLHATCKHTEIDWTTPRALIMGAEAGGLTDEEMLAADQRLRIPMRAPVESLNVSTALAIVLYEAARQRAQ